MLSVKYRRNSKFRKVSYVEKILDDRGFTFCRPSQILSINQIIATSLSQRRYVYVWQGTGAQQFRGLVVSEIHRRRPWPDSTNLSFHLSGMIADHRRNLGRVGKIETLPILQICPRPSQTIGDIDDFEFWLVGKIWDSRETVKSPMVWDFLDMDRITDTFLINKPGVTRTNLSILLNFETDRRNLSVPWEVVRDDDTQVVFPH